MSKYDDATWIEKMIASLVVMGIVVLVMILFPAHHGDLGDDCSDAWPCHGGLVCARTGTVPKSRQPRLQCVALPADAPCQVQRDGGP